jgi:hypothetical protein
MCSSNDAGTADGSIAAVTANLMSAYYRFEMQHCR